MTALLESFDPFSRTVLHYAVKSNLYHRFLRHDILHQTFFVGSSLARFLFLSQIVCMSDRKSPY